MSKTSIFVTIPSFNDPDVANTVESVIRESSGQVHIHIGVCEQVTAYMDAWRVGRRLPAHCRVSYELYDDDLMGVGGARAAAESLYGGEDYLLQIDSHTRLQANWDQWMIETTKRLPPGGIVTGLMTNEPWSARGAVPVTNCKQMDEHGFPMFAPDLLYNVRRRWFPARHAHAGSIFGPAWLEDVLYDPYIMFIGEEPTLAVRLWTAGYDLYHVAMPVMHGYVRFPGRPWDNKPEWHEKNARSLRRCRSLLNIEDCDPSDPALTDLDIYGLGTERTLEEWQKWTGFDYRAGAVDASWGEWQAEDR